jgi:hypothetical protein
MKNSFATIKDTSLFCRIQVDIIFQSYVFHIPMIFLSYESKEPLLNSIYKGRKHWQHNVNLQ